VLSFLATVGRYVPGLLLAYSAGEWRVRGRCQESGDNVVVVVVAHRDMETLPVAAAAHV